MPNKIERGLAFAFGVVFIVTMLAIALLIPDPTPFQYSVFRTVLSLAAAGFAVFLPGLLNVNWKGVIRAGGALGAFVVVYFFSPAVLPAPQERNQHSYTPRQMELAYSAVFGPRPSDYNRTYPLDGARMYVSPATDSRTGANIRQLFQRRSIKIVLADYVWSACNNHLLDSIYFAESISPFITIPIDIFVINIDERQPPTFGEISQFFIRWRIRQNAYFISTRGSEFQRLVRGLGFFYREESLNGRRHINFSTVAIIYGPSGHPLEIIPGRGEDTWRYYRDFLYRVADNSPELINREAVTSFVPELGWSLIPEAHAEAPPSRMTLRQSIERTARARRDLSAVAAGGCMHH